MADVFISYAREDAAAAERLAQALERSGYTCWWDRNLVSGSRYLTETEAQLKSSKAVVVIWSRASVTSHWVADEAAVGRDENRLAALSFDGSTPPLGFRQFQVTDFADWQGGLEEAPFRNLVAGLARIAPQDARHSDPPARPAAPANGNLPRRLEPLIGREAEKAQIAAGLSASPLVTLTGPGGIGKTRLAIEVARDLSARLEDGAFLVELAPLTDPASLPGAIAQAMGVELREASEVELVERLRSSRALIVLDNCEHLIETAARLVETMLAKGPGLSFLVTSQEVLGLEGERVVRLRSLSAAESEQLFMRAAGAADPEFAQQPADTDAIKAICERLDGVALAIEMAAAQAPVLGYRELLHALDDRFHVLTAGRRTALPRQRTLQATLDWSHSLLTPAEATVFRRLAVFAGGCTLEAARGVISDAATDPRAVTQALALLTRKSLLFVDRDNGPQRYRLLETMRAYAQQKLLEADETEALRKRHAAYFSNYFEPLAGRWIGVHENELEAFIAETSNLEAAFEWAFSPRGDTALGAALAANGFLLLHSLARYGEERRWIEKGLANADTLPRTLHERLLAGYGLVNVFLAQPDMQAFASVEEAVPPGSDRVARAMAIVTRAMYAARTRQNLSIPSCRDEIAGLGFSTVSLPSLVLDLAEVMDAARQVPPDPALLAMRTDVLIERARQAGSDNFIFYGCAHGCGALAPWRTEPDIAIAAARDLIRDVQVTRTRRARSNALPNLAGRLAMALCERNGPGDLAEARSLYAGVFRRLGDPARTAAGSSVALTSSFVLPLAEGRFEDAAKVCGFLQLRTSWLLPDVGRLRERIEERLSPDVFARALLQGEGLTLHEALTLVLGPDALAGTQPRGAA